jgi:DNA-directed RNA polymerase specialized sigma24 family protein
MVPTPTNPATNERTILNAARAGGESAFARLLEEHRSGLALYCYLMLGDSDAGRDALGDAVLTAWRERGLVDAHTDARTWLYRTAARVCINAVDGERPCSGSKDNSRV